MHRGFICLWRKIQSHKWWLSEKFTRSQAWIDLIMLANHKEGRFYIRGNLVTVKRGQIGHSERTLAARWRWSRNKVRRFLKDLKTEQQIEQQKSNVLGIISIVNYDRYQQNDTTDETTERPQKDHRKTETINNNNEKNIKENIIKEKKSNFGTFKNVKLTDEELQKLRQKFGDNQTREFINSLSEYLESKGKKYKSHYATILSWSRKNGYKKTGQIIPVE